MMLKSSKFLKVTGLIHCKMSCTKIMRETKIGFSQLMVVGILLIVPSLLPYASAEVAVDWTLNGIPFSEMSIIAGNLDGGG